MTFATYSALSSHADVAPVALADRDVKRLPLHVSAMLVSALSVALWAGIGAVVYWLVG